MTNLSIPSEHPRPAVHVRELSADLDTPVSAYLKLTHGQTGPSFLLESVEGGERQARYSFLGVGERGRLTAHGTRVTVTGSFAPGFPQGQTLDLDDPLAYLYAHASPSVPVPRGLPEFIGGAVGYVAYDLIRVYERLPDQNPDEIGAPDALFVMPEGMVIFDHLKHRLFVTALHDSEQAAEAVTARLVERLRAPLSRPLPGDERAPVPEFTSNFAPGEYARSVEACQEYIRAGDVFQVVPSQRFSAPLTMHPFALYRTLRSVNPSPYLGYLDLGDVILVASSPESLLRSDGHAITTRPIAGTRPRGATPQEDQALAGDLLADEKERAEHLMLVDLGRNDIGRVAAYGSVKVHDAFSVERYSHVMHIVSGVTGQLRPGLTPLHALASVLPMGTVSGAPKIRAMEIIDEQEPVRRGPYGGAFGYIAQGGGLDMALTLRTMVIKDGRIHIQAGAGVVADSDPLSEEQETRNKAAALMRAVQLACEGL